MKVLHLFLTIFLMSLVACSKDNKIGPNNTKLTGSWHLIKEFGFKMDQNGGRIPTYEHSYPKSNDNLVILAPSGLVFTWQDNGFDTSYFLLKKDIIFWSSMPISSGISLENLSGNSVSADKVIEHTHDLFKVQKINSNGEETLDFVVYEK